MPDSEKEEWVLFLLEGGFKAVLTKLNLIGAYFVLAHALIAAHL